MTASWRCLEPNCTDHGTGTPAEVDLAARKHAEKPPKHATATRIAADRKKRP